MLVYVIILVTGLLVTKIVMLTPCCMFRSPHAPNVIVSTCLLFSEYMEFRVPQCVVLSTLLLSCLLDSSILLSTLFPFNVSIQVSHPYKIVGKHEGLIVRVLNMKTSQPPPRIPRIYFAYISFRGSIFFFATVASKRLNFRH